MTKRRRQLSIVVLALLIANTLFVITLYKRHFAYNATITYIGLDSLGMVLPVRTRPAKWVAGKWDIDPAATLNANMSGTFEDTSQRPLALVSLAPQPTYGRAIGIIRALKARHVCNVLIREGGRLDPEIINFPGGPDRALEIPAVVLCGNSVGDAGFQGVLPADGPIHVDRP
jgi:hypothetical protein